MSINKIESMIKRNKLRYFNKCFMTFLLFYCLIFSSCTPVTHNRSACKKRNYTKKYTRKKSKKKYSKSSKKKKKTKVLSASYSKSKYAYQTGMASYYATKFHGRQTASGETFNMYALTAAHRKLSFGTKVRVTNLSNNKSVTVKINDRGPYAKARIIDLSYAAASKIGMIKSGVAKVRVDILK